MRVEDLTKYWVYLIYGYTRVTGWTITATNVALTFMALMKLYFPRLNPLYSILVIIAVGLVFAVVTVYVGRRSMSINKGIASTEMALMFANNPVMASLTKLIIAVAKYQVEPSEENKTQLMQVLKEASEELSRWQLS